MAAEIGSVRAGERATVRVAILAISFLGWALGCLLYDILSPPALVEGVPDSSALDRGLFFSFLAWIFEYPIFFLIGAVLVLCVYNVIGAGLGISRLFLHAQTRPRFLGAFGAAVVAGQLMTATFFVESRFHSSQRVVAQDKVYEHIARLLIAPLKPFFAEDSWYLNLQTQRLDRRAGYTGRDRVQGMWNEVTPHVGRLNVSRDGKNHPEDFAWRSLTFVLVTAAPLWFILALPALPMPAFEGLRFNPRGIDDERWLTPGWPLRSVAWLGGIFAGIVFVAFLIWIGIPITWGISDLVGWGYSTGTAPVAGAAQDPSWMQVLIRWVLGWVTSYAGGDQRVLVTFFAKVVFLSIGFGSFLALLAPGYYHRVSPGLAISAFLWLLLHLDAGYLMLRDHNLAKLLLVLGSVLYLGFSNFSYYKLTIPGLDIRWYDRPPRAPKPLREDEAPPPPPDDQYREVEAPGGGEALVQAEPRPKHRLKLQDQTIPSRATPSPLGRPEPPGQEPILEAWLENLPGRGRDGGLPKLAVVCVSGGALRSAVWTSVVLEAIEAKIPGFTRHIRVISGASGGMLGTAAFVAREHRRRVAEAEGTVEAPIAAVGRDLRLIPRLNHIGDIPRGGRNLIVVASLDDVLHFRVFDSHGKKVADTDETRLTEKARQIQELREQLERSWPPRELAEDEKGRFIDAVTSIVSPTLAEDLGKIDSLSAVARQMALMDPISMFDPRRQEGDRGRVLEETWAGLLPRTFGDLAPFEEQGKIPSLIFAPMFVEDGRRLLISNLNLEFLTKTRGPILLDEASRINYGQFLSQGALELRTLFPEDFPKFLLRTAVRLNASFPYVSPAVSLPTEPPRRPVDAGYYDNFGVNIACRWIEKHREWLLRETSGVILVQIRDHMGQKDRFEFTDDGAGFSAWLNRLMSFLTTPISGVNKARNATTSFRNDEQIDTVNAPLLGGGGFFGTVIFEFQNDGEVALNWQLCNDEISQIQAGMQKAKNDERLGELADWWEEKASPTRQARHVRDQRSTTFPVARPETPGDPVDPIRPSGPE